MLTNWVLENFKPISGHLNLALGKTTVLAGLNSTGKSSVLQSILLLAQTLANPNPNKPLILNGHIVQLGTYEDILNDNTKDAPVGIGVTLAVDEARTWASRSLRARSRYAIDERIRSITALIRYRGARERGGSADRASLEAVRVKLVSSDLTAQILQMSPPGSDAEPQSEGLTVRASVAPLAAGEYASFIKDVRAEYLRLVPYPPDDNYLASLGVMGTAETRKGLTRLAHCLPDRLIVPFNLAARRRRDVARAIAYLARPTDWPPPPQLQVLVAELQDAALPAVAIAEANALADAKGVPAFTGAAVAEFLEWAAHVPLKTRAKGKFVAGAHAIAVKSLSDRNDTGESLGLESAADDILVAVIEAATRRLTAQLSSLVRYIGPLRADPQAAQKFAPSSEPDDVGVKGEFAAAVYDANRRESVQWWDPITRTARESILEEAVDVWARHIGVAHHVSTREAGLSGVSWAVQPLPESRERPLPSLGVGVSQILPILVSGLLAPRGAILLIEQPELHLHPRAQAKLGDFFYGLSRSGKQCIIETHSDCLVNQLRLHMVRDESCRSWIKMYFVTQDRNGISKFEPVQISRNGHIKNWPAGFFDESVRQEEQIAREALERNGTP